MNLPYTIVIQWSDEDNCYLVSLPEFPSQKFHTHGETYELIALFVPRRKSLDSRLRGNDSFSFNGICGAFISAHLLIYNHWFYDWFMPPLSGLGSSSHGCQPVAFLLDATLDHL